MHERNKPQVGERWRHYKGGLYDIIGFATCAELNVEGVLYKSVEHEVTYFRTLTRFMSYVQPNNSLRFERV